MPQITLHQDFDAYSFGIGKEKENAANERIQSNINALTDQVKEVSSSSSLMHSCSITSMEISNFSCLFDKRKNCQFGCSTKNSNSAMSASFLSNCTSVNSCLNTHSILFEELNDFSLENQKKRCDFSIADINEKTLEVCKYKKNKRENNRNNLPNNKEGKGKRKEEGKKEDKEEYKKDDKEDKEEDKEEEDKEEDKEDKEEDKEEEDKEEDKEEEDKEEEDKEEEDKEEENKEEKEGEHKRNNKKYVMNKLRWKTKTKEKCLHYKKSNILQNSRTTPLFDKVIPVSGLEEKKMFKSNKRKEGNEKNNYILKKKKKTISNFVVGELSGNLSITEGFSGTSGKIKIVKLKNFLIHKNLIFFCSPHANLIIGRNGQGKSAIAQGIAVCCGVDGRKAGRSTHLISYIKDYFQNDGPSSAQVSIHFSNEGLNAYKPDVFGTEIILTRIIRKCGNGEYRIQGVLNNFLGDKKNDVTDFLDSMHIDLESPVVYLSQELSKTLLNSSKSTSLYNFFYKSVGLEMCEKLLLIENEMLQETKKHMDIHSETIKPKLQRTEDLVEKLKKVSNLIDLIQQAKILEVCEKYAELESLVKAHRDIEYAIKAASECINSLLEEKKEVIFTMEHLETVKASLLKERTEVKAEIMRIGDMYEQCSLRFKEFARNCDSTCQKHKIAKDAIKKIKKQIEELENDKQEAERKIKIDYSTEINQITKTIEKYKELKEETSKIMQKNADEKEDLEEKIEKLREERERLQKEIKKIELDKQEKASAIKFHEEKIKHQSKSTIRKYLWNFDLEGALCQLREMTASGAFKAMPVGPIGEYVKINEEYLNRKNYKVDKIAYLIERHLKNHFNRWLVASSQDRNKLILVLKQHGCNSAEVTVVTGFHLPVYAQVMTCESNNRGAVEGFYIPPEILTIFKCLEKDNNLVINYLIDTASIEKVCICHTFTELHRCLNDPKLKVNSGYELEEALYAKKVGFGVETPYQNKGFFNFKYVQLHATSPAALQESVSKYEKYLKELTSIHTSFLGELDNCNKLIDDENKKLYNIKEKENKIRQKRNMLTEHLYNQNAALEETQALQSSQELADFDVFDKEILEMKTKVEAKEEIIKELEENINKIEEMKKKEKEEHKNLAAQGKELLRKVESIDNSGKEVQKEYLVLNSKKKDLDLQIDQKKEEISKLSEQKIEAAEVIKKFKAELDKLPRLDQPIEKPINSYKEEKENIFHRIAAASNHLLKNTQNLIDPIELHKCIEEEYQKLVIELEKARDEFDSASSDYRQVKLNYQNQSDNYRRRYERFRQTKIRLENKIRCVFRKQLKDVLSFYGDLIFDHEKKNLIIKICNKDLNQNVNESLFSESGLVCISKDIINFDADELFTSDTKSLSGGERSSIQLAFLTAVAKEAYSPFHIFDELDVYMDDLNRVKNMNQIFEFSRHETDRQFFFITPHYEVKNYVMKKHSDLVKVFDLSEEKS